MHFKKKNTTFVKFNFYIYQWTLRTKMPPVLIGFIKDYWHRKTKALKLLLATAEVTALRLVQQRHL